MVQSPENKKLVEIAEIFTGVRLKRFEKGDTTPQKALLHKSISQENSVIEPETVRSKRLNR